MPNWPLALLVALALALAGCSAQAQEVTIEPSAAQRCMQHLGGPELQPEYPAAAFNANRGGRVQVELEFRAPDQPPRVLVLLHEGEPDILDAVQNHVRGMRVPCMTAGAAPARLNQDYVFQSDQRRVHWAHPVDAESSARSKLLACLSHLTGKRSPDYPSSLQRQAIQGRVLARLRFDRPDQPPRAEVFARQRLLAQVIEDWAQGYRLPCLQGEPVEGVWTFVFRFEGERFGFKEVPFMGLLRIVEGIYQQTLDIDTTAMNCPFDLRMTYRRPELPNAIGEVGASHPARRPLLDWLAQAELDLRASQLDAVHGDRFKITVPCLKLNLKPKEKS